MAASAARQPPRWAWISSGLVVSAGAIFLYSRAVDGSEAPHAAAASAGPQLESQSPRSGGGAPLASPKRAASQQLAETPSAAGDPAPSDSDEIDVHAGAPTVPYTIDSWATVGTLDREKTPDWVFDEIYPTDMDYAELVGVRSGKHLEYTQRSLDLGLAAFERGDYEERMIPWDEANQHYVSGWEGETFETPDSVIQRDGKKEGWAKVAWLRYNEHPELYNLRDEWLYLRKREQAAFVANRDQ